jgi:ribosomal protein S18 acetylase RimI-like enzyme
MISIHCLSPEEINNWEALCDGSWEHGQIIPPINRTDIEKQAPLGMIKSHLMVEEGGSMVAGLTVQIDKHAHLGSYGAKYWLDLWVIEEKKGKIEDELIQKVDAMCQKEGVTHMISRIPDHNSRFTRIFELAGYEPIYEEDTFIREAQTPLDDIILSYYEDAQKKVHLRVSKNIQEDITTYTGLVNEISEEVPNMSPLDRHQLHSMITGGKKHMIGVWIFAEVHSEPAGFIGGLVSIQQLFGTPQVVGNIINNGVLNTYRGMGIGTALYVKMIEEMRKWNVTHILDYMVMKDNVPEQTLLTELGFTVAQTHVKMQRTL